MSLRPKSVARNHPLPLQAFLNAKSLQHLPHQQPRQKPLTVLPVPVMAAPSIRHPAPLPLTLNEVQWRTCTSSTNGAVRSVQNGSSAAAGSIPGHITGCGIMAAMHPRLPGVNNTQDWGFRIVWRPCFVSGPACRFSDLWYSNRKKKLITCRKGRL